MIEWILQLENQNMLQVHYSSGYDNSIKVEMPNADGWYRTFYYWLDKDNPNKGIMSQVRIKNKLYGNHND